MMSQSIGFLLMAQRQIFGQKWPWNCFYWKFSESELWASAVKFQKHHKKYLLKP